MVPLKKKPTGITGFDDISQGGLPEGRIVSVVGRTGSGKTVFALQTLVNRARLFGESGLFISFEEPVERLAANAAGFHWAIDELTPAKIRFLEGKLPLDAELNGEFDLCGLLAHATHLVRESGARMVVIDGLDLLLGLLPDIAAERREIRRMDQWVLENNLSCILTLKAELESERERARHEFLQYITDCVVALSGHMYETTYARSVRIVKYRGSGFAANAFPAVITEDGFEVAATRGSRLSYPKFEERVSSGVPSLDLLIDGGYRRGTTTLISGAPGTSKTTFSCHFIRAACERGETVGMVSLDESDTQIILDAATIGIDLQRFVESKKLIVAPLRSNARSPEEHFVFLRRMLDEHKPTCLVIDPISALMRVGSPFGAVICETLLDEARARGITLLCTSLIGGPLSEQELSLSNVSTIADTWLHLTYILRGGERNRALTIVKSRGTKHTRQMHELAIGPSGIELLEVYTAKGEVLMGTARAQERAADRVNEIDERLAQARREFDLRRAQSEIELKLKMVQAELDWKTEELAIVEAAAREKAENALSDAEERRRLRFDGIWGE
jgi:circadian clock protein KaiC